MHYYVHFPPLDSVDAAAAERTGGLERAKAPFHPIAAAAPPTAAAPLSEERVDIIVVEALDHLPANEKNGSSKGE